MIIETFVITAILLTGFRLVYQYQNGLRFRFGKCIGIVHPGLRYVIPVIERMDALDMRTITVDVPPQDCITRDNVPVKVNAVLYYKVVQAKDAILEIRNYKYTVAQYAQSTLRSVIGKFDLDSVLGERTQIGEEIRKIVDVATDPWGIKVTAVEVKDIELPQEMKRAMARQAEAERDRKAHVIKSLGEVQAAENIGKAATMLSKVPGAVHLRTLQTLSESAPEPNTTIIIPLPVDMLKAFEGRKK